MRRSWRRPRSRSLSPAALALSSPCPLPSSSSGSDDFAALLDSELELPCGADSAFPGDHSSAFPATDDEGEDEDPKELEVEAIEQNGWRKIELEDTSYRLATGVHAPERAVDVFAWKHILPSDIPVIQDRNLNAFIVLQFMSAWNNGQLMPISTDGQKLRKNFVIDLLAYDGNSRRCMIPVSLREYLSRIIGKRQ